MDNEEQTHVVQLVAVRQAVELKQHPVSEPITLDLARWTPCASASANAQPNDMTIVKDVLQYFLNVATANSLRDTVAAQKLDRALTVINDISPETNMSHILICDRHAFEQSNLALTRLERLCAPLAGQQLQLACDQLVQTAQYWVPIFNIWDSISLIYTLCAEPVTDNLHAELHLFQFRTIVQILSRHWYTGPAKRLPSTVVATWSSPDRPPKNPVTITFATSSAASPTEKTEMAKARYAFAQGLIKGLEVIKSQINVLGYYRPGNCPEWLTFIIVCRHPGQYLSICQTTSSDRIYKLCGYCQKLQEALARMQIDILDLWTRSSLGEGDAVEVPLAVGFSYRKLMGYLTITENFGDLAGVSQ